MRLKAFVVAAAMAVLPTLSQAATYTLTFVDDGTDVVATGVGTFDLTGLPFDGLVSVQPYVHPNSGDFMTGAQDFSMQAYAVTLTSPQPWGSGTPVLASSGSGDSVAFWTGGRLFLSQSYATGDALLSIATWNNHSLASLGLSVGTQSYSFGNNTFNMVFTDSAAAPVPLPASVALLLAGLGGLGALRSARG
ncbi:MAG: VPLPA-CTERM sorting domain-containing protein [Pseudomonadota bacterium]